MTTFGFFKVFGPYIAIVALLLVVLMFRGDKIKAEGVAKLAVAHAEEVEGVNRQNAATMAAIGAASIENTRIQSELASKVSAINANTARTDEAIKKAYRDDPQARAWAATPIPVGVREALNH